MTSTMKAIVRYNYCESSNLKIENLLIPTPQENEVLVRIHTTTINRTDVANLNAKPFIMRFVTGIIKPKRPITGTDFSGVIQSIGTNVSAFDIGDHVIGFADEGLSSHTEYLTFPVNKGIIHAPIGLSHAEAVACCEGFHYAWNMANKVTLVPGQRALVNGATGAIGSAVVQILKHKGLHITAVCDTGNLSLIKSLGADRVIDYKKADFTKENNVYNFVFDAVGKSSFGLCRRQLAPQGIYISSELGRNGQNVFYSMFAFILSLFMQGKKVIFPIPSDIRASLALVKKMVAEKAYKPVIDREYPMEDVIEAFQFVEKGFKTGNVILRIHNNSDEKT